MTAIHYCAWHRACRPGFVINERIVTKHGFCLATMQRYEMERCVSDIGARRSSSSNITREHIG
jgi:hypothetical protein